MVQNTPETQIVENTQVNSARIVTEVNAAFRYVLVETMVASHCRLFIECHLWLLHAVVSCNMTTGNLTTQSCYLAHLSPATPMCQLL